MSGTILLGLVCLVIPVIYKHAGMGMHKYIKIVGMSGLFFLLSAVFADGIWVHETLVKIGVLCQMGTYFLGFLGLLIGTLMGTLDVMFDTGEVITH